MVDVHSREQRRRNMAAIKGKDTKPEMVVRRLVYRLGYRYRLHSRDLPGRPDLLFRSRRKVIFVHGCFWHMHECRYGQVEPQTNARFWQEKRQANVQRDRRQVMALESEGWHVLVVWECQTRDDERLTGMLTKFLETRSPRG